MSSLTLQYNGSLSVVLVTLVAVDLIDLSLHLLEDGCMVSGVLFALVSTFSTTWTTCCCCSLNFSLKTWLCLRPYLWLGLRSSCTVLLALFWCVLWYSVRPEYLNLDPILKKFCLALGPFTGACNRKKPWCSTAHFHRCLHAFSLCNLYEYVNMKVLQFITTYYLNTKVCSCSLPWSSSSTTTKVNFFFLKFNLPIFGQKNKPIFCCPSNTNIPVGVRPKWYSIPSFP